jgi:Ca-activated chloride channel family protein
VLFIISDGADQHSKHTLEEAARAVRDARLQVYTIGYFSEHEEPIFSKWPEKIILDDGRVIDNPKYVLKKLASDSGAESFFPRSDKELAQAVERIVKDLRTQYTLGFYPQSPDNDTHYHQLRVVARGGRYRVRARPGYGS